MKLSNGTWTTFLDSLAGGYPQAVAVDNSGNVYVTEGSNPQAWLCLSSTVKEWSNGTWTDITNRGNFSDPQSLAVDSSGNVYVADTYHNKVKKMLNGIYWTRSAGGDLWDPCGVAKDRFGNVYVADTTHNKIKKLTNGTWTNITGNNYEFWNPHGIAVDGPGNVYVADTRNNQIKELLNGRWTVLTDIYGSSGDLYNPKGVAVDISGNVYVADTWHDQIKMLSNGYWVNITGDGKFWHPCGITVDFDGKVYVADTWHYQIKKELWNGHWTVLTDANGSSGDLWDHEGVAVDSSGNVYVADTRHNRIMELSNGTWMDISGNGNFSHPEGIMVDRSGDVYVPDTWNEQIKELSGWSGSLIRNGNGSTPTSGTSVPIFTPTITPGGGIFTTSQSVFIGGASVDQSVYYTTDGSDPTVSGSVYYTGPFTLSQPATVKAAVCDSVYGWSSVTSARFDIIAQPEVSNNTVNISLSNGLTQGSPPAALDLAGVLPGSVTANGDNSETINDTLNLSVGGSIYIHIPAGTTVSSSVYLGDLSVQQDEPLMLISPPPSNAAVLDCSFGVADVTFSQPITITIPTTNPNAQAYYLDHGVWMALGGIWSNNQLTFTVDHFSTFTTYDPPAGSITFSPADGSTVSRGSAVTLTAPANSSRILYYFTSTLPTTFDVSSAAAIDGSTGTTSPVTDDYLVAEFVDNNGVASQMFSAHYNVYANTGGGNNSPANTGSATVAPAAGGTVSLGSEASVTIPKDALNGSQNVTVNVQSVSSPPAPPAGDTIMGAYEFTVNGGGYTFNSPVTLTFKFDSSKLPAGTVPVVEYYDNTTNQWVLLQGTVSGDTIAVTVNHFTTFAVIAVPKTQTVPAFSDVPSSYWAYDVISGLSSQGYVNGYPDGVFKPDDSITRAEFISIMNKVLKLSPYTPAAPDFSDVSASDWFYQPVENAVYAGIAKGSDGSFMPDDPITREQMAVILMNALGQQDLAETGMNTQTGFTDDASISGWAIGAVAAAEKDGLLKGYPDGSFKPQDGATRAEACTMIENFLKLYSPGK